MYVKPAPTSAVPESLPLNFARTLSWISLVLIMASCLGISGIIANSARETLITRQEDFARLLAVNLNHQIYRRFTLPTALTYGRIALRQPAQYEKLEQVVQSVIHGLNVEKVRIYDVNRIVTYSSDRAELGRTGIAPRNIDETLHGSTASFSLEADIPAWQALFRLPLKPGTFSLRVLYPLRVDNQLPGAADTPAMGILELKQDITEDYARVVAFQWLIVGVCLLSSIVLFTLLQLFIRRSERVLAQRMEETRRLEQELHSNERLASMGRVVASIAHEIRNPLGIIRSSAELLIRRISGSDKSTGRILEAIFDESVRLSQTVNDFLDYARPKQPRQDLVNINLVLDQVMAFLEEHFHSNNVAIERNSEQDLFVLGDKDLLYRAFYNIMTNARQAMDGPGIIAITATRQANNTLALSFSDSGPGFPPDNISQSLDPFFTTKDHGTGLGLPIVNSIISSHGGEVFLANNPEGGAVVQVILPATAPEPSQPPQPEGKENI